jgi:hypothetical protein
MKEYRIRFDVQEEMFYTWAHRGHQIHATDPFLPVQGELPFIPDRVVSIDRKRVYEEHMDYEIDRVARKIRRIRTGSICSGEEVLLIALDDPY